MKRRFYITSKNVHQKSFEITDDQVKQIRAVLRLGIGEKIELTDGRGSLYTGTIKEITKTFVSGSIEEQLVLDENEFALDLAQGIGKSDKFERIIAQATELGVHRIIPIETEFSVRKVNNQEKMNERWNKIIISSVKQSGNPFAPTLENIQNLNYINSLSSKYDLSIMFDPLGTETLYELKDEIKKFKSILVVVGPEGGFSPSERKAFKGKVINIKGYILRTETAPIVGISIIKFLKELF